VGDTGIRLTQVSMTFPGRGGRRPLTALAGLDLACPAGSVTAVIGPNGCGKSTLLRLLAGLLTPSSGDVVVGGSSPRPGDRRIGLVFQQPRLLPWRSALDNVAMPLTLAGVDPGEARQRAEVAMEQVGLAGAGNLRPAELSGGMQQRTGLARGLVLDPEVLLLDEPFSALDALTRDAFDAELARLVSHAGRTVVLVTHSVAEAVLVADRVIVLTARPGSVAADIAIPGPRQPAPDPVIEEQLREVLAALQLPELRAWTPAA